MVKRVSDTSPQEVANLVVNTIMFSRAVTSKLHNDHEELKKMFMELTI